MGNEIWGLMPCLFMIKLPFLKVNINQCFIMLFLQVLENKKQKQKQKERHNTDCIFLLFVL